MHDVFHITRANGGTRSCPLKVQGARSRSRRDARPPPGQGRGDRTGGAASPWFEPWHQEQHRWSEDYARKAVERGERNSLVASMPPDLRAAYGAAQKASHDQLYQALEPSTVEREVLCLDQKHGQLLTTAGRQVRITAGSAKAGRLPWPAVQTDNKHQARRCSRGHASCARQRLPPNRARETKGTPWPRSPTASPR